MNNSLASLLSALLAFENAYMNLNNAWDSVGDATLNELEAIALYPFSKSFDELQISEWIDATIKELSSKLPRVVVNHRCLSCEEHFFDKGYMSCRVYINELDCPKGELPRIQFDKRSIETFLRRSDDKGFFTGKYDKVCHMNDMQVYLLYDAYINKQYGGCAI